MQRICVQTLEQGSQGAGRHINLLHQEMHIEHFMRDFVHAGLLTMIVWLPGVVLGGLATRTHDNAYNTLFHCNLLFV